MDKDRVKGSIKQAVGGAKKLAGKAVGDKKLEAEGASQEAEGELQNAIGGVKDTIRDIIKK